MPYFDDYAGFDENMKEGATPPTPASEPQPDPGTTAAHTIFDYIELLICTIVFVLLLTTFFFRHAIVVGPSMQHTLEDGEHLIISDLFYAPERGDIIVLESYEETGIGEPIIKRIIGVEGDTVTIREDGVYVNDVFLDESYTFENGNGSVALNDYITYGIRHDLTGALNEDRTEFNFYVGENEVFVLGDNRFNSTDSRSFGPVNEDCILGHVVLRITPFSKFGGVD